MPVNIIEAIEKPYTVARELLKKVISWLTGTFRFGVGTLRIPKTMIRDAQNAVYALRKKCTTPTGYWA